jgi:hypothetical protein
MKRLTEEWSSEVGTAWSASGEEIWFTSSARTEPQSLRAVNRSGQLRLILSTVSDLSLHDVSKTGNVLLAGVRNSTEVAVGRKNQKPDRILELADENAGIGGISNGGKVVALVYSGIGGGQDYKTLMVTDEMSEPVLLGDGDPTSVSPDGEWILSLVPSSPGKLILYPTSTGESRTIDISPVRMVAGFSTWTTDGSKLLFTGAEQNRPPRAYLLDLRAGAARAVTPEDTSEAIISPDGLSVIARNNSLVFRTYRVGGGESAPVKGLRPEESPIQWGLTSNKLFIWDRTLPAKIFQLDVTNGKRKLWLEIVPADASGLLYGEVTIASDGQAYAYHYRRVLTNLFLVENLH